MSKKGAPKGIKQGANGDGVSCHLITTLLLCFANSCFWSASLVSTPPLPLCGTEEILTVSP